MNGAKMPRAFFAAFLAIFEWINTYSQVSDSSRCVRPRSNHTSHHQMQPAASFGKPERRGRRSGEWPEIP